MDSGLFFPTDDGLSAIFPIELDADFGIDVVLPTSDGSIVRFDVNVGRPPERRISWSEIRH